MLIAAPRTSAAPSLALPRVDYPRGAAISTLPATNSLVDQYLQPAHRSSFEQLHRVDGSGWLQFASWHFTTGRGSATQVHSTIFGYGINLFHGAVQASRALGDVKLKTRPFKVARLPALFYRTSDVHQTLAFVFFAFKQIEVEAYYEYDGVAPAKVTKMLGKIFSRQRSHLATRIRALSKALSTSPTDTTNPIPTATPTATTAPTATPTVTPVPAATTTPTAVDTPTPTATVAPTSTATPLPTATATATPVMLAVDARIDPASIGRSGTQVTVDADVTSNGQPVEGGRIVASFFFPDSELACQGTSDASGQESCSVIVPKAPTGSRVQVQVAAYALGQQAMAQIAFTVR